MGLKSDKNYVIANAVDVILMVPKKKIKEEESFVNKKTFGRIPDYLSEIKKQMEKEYKEIREAQLKQQDKSNIQ
jgi:hypothetical protein